jgi:DnaJ-class molecular chaperone
MDENPQNILGVPQDAKLKEIRTAYLNKIKEYPPEKFPEEFERVRDAYTILSNVRYRMRLMLQTADPEASMETLLDDQKQNRQFRTGYMIDAEVLQPAQVKVARAPD